MWVHPPPGHLLPAALSLTWVSALLKAWLYLLIQWLYPMMKRLEESPRGRCHNCSALRRSHLPSALSVFDSKTPDCMKNKTRRLYCHCIRYVWLQLQFIQASLSKNLLISLAYLLCHWTLIPWHCCSSRRHKDRICLCLVCTGTKTCSL